MAAPLFFLLFLGTTCCEASKHKAGRALCSGKLEVIGPVWDVDSGGTACVTVVDCQRPQSRARLKPEGIRITFEEFSPTHDSFDYRFPKWLIELHKHFVYVENVAESTDLTLLSCRVLRSRDTASVRLVMTPETNSTDWSTSYSQYLARSAAISARTLNLYQLVLERVSQGKLPPTIFQDHFPSFAAVYGAEFANRFAEVGSRFLSDLVRLGSSFSQQPLDTGVAASERETIPPRFDPSNPTRWYEQIAEYAGQLNARAIKAYRAQLDRVAAGDTTPSEAQQHTAEQMAQQLPGYMQLVTRLYFDLLNGLNDVRSAYEEAYFGGILATAISGDSEPPVTLTLAGPVGTTVATWLSVTNTTGQRTRIGHQVADVRRADGGGPSLIPAIVFVPEMLELEPGEEGTLGVSLQLDSKQYDTNVLYTGALQLTGGSEVLLEVELRILANAVAAKHSKA